MKRFLLALTGITLYSAVCAAQPAVIKVATYNLRMDTPADSANAWKYRSENVKALIEYHSFDLLGTQEGYIHQLRDICEIPDYEYVGAGRDDGRHAGEHSAIVYKTSRLQLITSGNFWLSATPEQPSKGWDAKCCNRLCTWAQFKDKQTERTFFVFNVHFDHEGEEARRESAMLMLSKIKALAGNAPVVCMGDFNSAEDTEQIRTMLTALADARSRAAAKPYGPEGTFNTRFRNPVQERIDYIFVNILVKVLRYAVLTDNNGQFYPSDHLPVMAILSVE